MIRSELALKSTTTLSLEGETWTIDNERSLHAALERLPLLTVGQEVVLARGPKHYIKAIRRGDHWSASVRKGSFLTLGSFTAGSTTEYSDRQVKESRAAGSIWKRIAQLISSPPAEYALSVTQVRTLFGEFLAGKKFSIPQSSA